MKKIGSLLLLLSVLICSCEKYDIPKEEVPQYKGEPANATIAEIQQMATDSNIYSLDTGVIIKCVVIGNDIERNIEGKIYVQDATGGYAILLSRPYTYCRYPIGQTLFVHCGSLLVNPHPAQLFLAMPFYGANGYRGIWENEESAILFKHGKPAIVEPTEISSPLDSNYDKIHTLVHFSDVKFVLNDSNAAHPVRYIHPQSGERLQLITSSQAYFGQKPLPTGKCDITGVLIRKEGEWALVMRKWSDIEEKNE